MHPDMAQNNTPDSSMKGCYIPFVPAFPGIIELKAGNCHSLVCIVSHANDVMGQGLPNSWYEAYTMSSDSTHVWKEPFFQTHVTLQAQSRIS